jgi:transcriptional regulator of acetoin/glycerol metabolism
MDGAKRQNKRQAPTAATSGTAHPPGAHRRQREDIGMISAHIDRIFASLLGRAQLPAHPLGPEVVASWRRCVEEYRLEPARVDLPHVLTAGELKEFRDPADELIAVAQPELDRLFRRLIGEDYVVLFTDTNGVAIDFRVGEALEEDARRSGLYLGSIWNERHQGTNGVGTCLTIERPVSIVQDDHFASHNVSLTCTVAPVYGPDGSIIAVLDVSTPRATNHGRQRLVLDIVLNSARRIENRIFRKHYRDEAAVVVQLSPDPDFIDAAEECLLALDDAGRVIAADRQALKRLAYEPGTGVLGRRVESVLRVEETALLATAREGAAVELAALAGAQGQLYARALQQRRPLARSTKPAREPAQPRPQASPQPDLERLAGSDPRMARAVAAARRLIDVGLPILVTGETGAGKGAFAEALHRASGRGRQSFVAINCAALPEALIESELFGYQPGAFTGAARNGARGKLLEAHGGTLFLDEIGDMPMPLQTRLLRTLSEGEVTPLGGGRAVRLDVAVIAATHQPLERLVADGRFREDLYHRLAGALIRVPALRERADRAALIAAVFAEEAQAQGSRARLGGAARALLEAYFWPGNVRQLRFVARYAVALCDGETILPEHLPEQLRGGEEEKPDEAQAVRLALDHCGWNVTAAARILGVSRATLHRQIRGYGLQRP